MGRQWPIIAGIILGGFLGLAVCLIIIAYASSAKASDDLSGISGIKEAERRNGCPLDAIRYDAPAFTRGYPKADNHSYKVRDRTSGSEWWLVYIDGEWVVLPINGTVDVA